MLFRSVAIFARLFEKSFAVGNVLIRTIKLAWLPFARDPVALDIFEVRRRPSRALAGEPDNARFYNDPARPECSQTVTAAKQPANRRTAPDPAAIKASRTYCLDAASERGRCQNPA